MLCRYQVVAPFARVASGSFGDPAEQLWGTAWATGVANVAIGTAKVINAAPIDPKVSDRASEPHERVTSALRASAESHLVVRQPSGLAVAPRHHTTMDQNLPDNTTVDEQA